MLSQDSNNINVKIANPEKLKITLVVSEWHSEITNKLFNGAKNLLIKGFLLDVIEKITDEEIKNIIKFQMGLSK